MYGLVSHRVWRLEIWQDKKNVELTVFTKPQYFYVLFGNEIANINYILVFDEIKCESEM
jgi:hypothetical protein